MKPYAKIGSLLLALIIAVAAVGCTPISLNAEWAYRTDKVELPNRRLQLLTQNSLLTSSKLCVETCFI